MAHTSGVHLLQIHPHLDSDVETDVDIIAIHGLDTKSPDTWIWKSKRPDSNNNVNWLADRSMLPSRVGQARIFTCDWPAGLFERSDLIQKRIEELARLLLDGIQRRARPLATNSYSEGDDRPIIFIASCLGGIILIKALVMADHEYRCLRRATKGIVFLATPFGGTSFQDVARWAEPGLKAWASIQGQKVSRLLQSVKGSTFNLDELVRGFTQVCRDNNLDQVMTFYETGKTNLYQKVFPYLPISSKQLVNESSATLQIVPNPLPLDRPHKIMNKFPSHNDPDYRKVAGKLEQFLQGIRKGTVLERADAYIRDKHYTTERLKIERLSGESLPMEQCYINLAIVEKLSENTDRSEEGQRGADLATQSSSFSVFARQKVETLDRAIQVEFATIFNERRRPNGDRIKPRRILIRGRAGMGKTTLCKKIVHEFAKGTWNEWSKLFNRVLWIPLRNLKLLERRQVPGYNHEDLFYHEYFSGVGQEEGHCLARELWRAIRDFRGNGGNGSLFILDGLDEVYQDLEHADAMSQFLKDLMKQPNVLITSRPSAPAPPDMDLELETVGFYPEQVKDYIEHAFTDRVKKITDITKVNEVQSFLREHWLIEGLTRIPIQLDALCYTWDDLKPEGLPNTMTGMYRLIELKLWKKDVIRLEKKHDGKLVTPSQITTSDVEDFVQDEVCFLEGLAFTGLYNNAIDFTSNNREVISKQFKSQGILLDKTLPCLSFVRTSDLSSKSGRQNYHFIHLTFQEYFAARYFIRQWHATRPLKCLELSSVKINETDPVLFLRKHKYTARYDIFWRFVTGLLDTTRQASPFINLIEKEPLDLLGPTHQRLVMHCLSEISSNLGIQKNFEARLSQWLLFEHDLTGYSHLARELECPEDSILKVLKTDSGGVRIGVLQALEYRRTHLSDAAITALTELLRDNEWQARNSAAKALGRQSSLSDPAITALTELLQDEWTVRSSAAEALCRQLNLLESAVIDLIALLQDDTWNAILDGARHFGRRSILRGSTITTLIDIAQKNEWNFRSSAAKVLGRQSNLLDPAMPALTLLLRDFKRQGRSPAAEAFGLSDATIATLVAMLQDDKWNVRYSVAEALGFQSNPSDPAITALTALLQDDNRDVQFTAASALGRRSNLSDPAIKTLTALLQDNKSNVRSSAAEVLGHQSNLLDPAITALAALLRDDEWDVRYTAAEALGRQSNLSNPAITALTELLQDDVSIVRSSAAEALGRQSNLSDPAITALTELLQHDRPSVRYAAAKAFGGQSNLSDPTITALTALLQQNDWLVQCAAAEAFGGRSNLSDPTITALTELLRDNKWEVRRSAASAFGRQSNLSDPAITALTALTELLQDDYPAVQYTAASALGRQSNLPDPAITALTALLQDNKSNVRSSAAEVLSHQSNLSDPAITALTKLLPDDELSIQYAAAQAIGIQSNLSDPVITAITALLQHDKWNVRSSVARVLGYQSNLSDKILEIKGLLLAFELPSKSMSRTFLHSQFLKSFYGSLICRSFREQLSLYVDSGSCCIINQPSGLRMASIAGNGADDQFRTALADGRQLWNINGYKLWDNLGDDAVRNDGPGTLR